MASHRSGDDPSRLARDVGPAWRRSPLTEGSEFVVRLPALAGEAPREVSTRRTLIPDADERRILVVEDNVETAEALAEVLTDAGCAVRVATDGPSALQAAAEFGPEVVLLDIGLPGMDGFEVARRLRADRGPERMVLVALTGYGQPEDLRRAQDAGFNHHIVKPIRLDAILAVLGVA